VYANKNNFPRHKNTQTNSREQKKTSHPSFVYLCIRVQAEKITALEKPWAEGTLIFLDTIQYLRCTHPQKFNPSETGFELIQLVEKKHCQRINFGANFFFHLVKKITPPF
jgi:hypothetical protein